MNNELCLELIPYNESGIVLYESSFQDIIERIKVYFHKLLIKIREFFTKLTSTQKIAVANNSKWVDENKESIEKGYKIFKSVNSVIKGKNIFDIVDSLKKELNVDFNNINYTQKLRSDLESLVLAYKREQEDFPVSELLNMDPKEEYTVNGSRITGRILANHNVEYHGIAEALDAAIKERMNYDDHLSDIDVKDIMKYATDNYDDINKTYKEMIRYLEIQLNSISDIGNKYKSNISLFSPAYRSQANKILDRSRILINDYISLVTLIHNRFLSFAKSSRNQAMNMLKLYAEFDEKEQVSPREEYDASGKLLETCGIFESVKFI